MHLMSERELLEVELEELRREHRALDEQTAGLAGLPGLAAIEMQRLKKKKLALKDRIARIEDQLYPDIIA